MCGVDIVQGVTHTAPDLFEQFPTVLPVACGSPVHTTLRTSLTPPQGRSHYFNRGMWDVFVQLI